MLPLTCCPCPHPAVSMENVLTDVTELEKGMESARRESFVRQNVRDEAMKVTLRDFLANAEEKLRWVLGSEGDRLGFFRLVRQAMCRAMGGEDD